MTESDKDKALAALKGLAEICKTGLDTLRATTANEQSETKSLMSILRKDTISIQKMIYTNTTRLSLVLGKSPPSYKAALEPINDLSTEVGQLLSCISLFSSGILRQEVFWAADGTVQALFSLAKHFVDKCSKDIVDEEYLAKTGAVHEAVRKAEEVSRDEYAAFVKSWKLNGEALKDSLDEVNQMLEEKGTVDDESGIKDDWDEILGGSTTKLSDKEMERVKKLYPLFRFTTLFHDKLLSNYIPHIKYSEDSEETTLPLRSLITFSNSLLVANDDLASALYAPQDMDNINECIDLVKELVNDFDADFGITNTGSASDELAAQLRSLSLDDSSESTKWFRKCLQQIRRLFDTLSLND